MELEEHYGQILGIESPWDVYSVDLTIKDHRVDLIIEYTDDEGACPECGAMCRQHDRRKNRTWRHLDTMHNRPICTVRYHGSAVNNMG